MEFFDYRKVNIDTSIVVDKSRGEKLTVNLNVTFPRVPCYRELVAKCYVSSNNQSSGQLGRDGHQWRDPEGCLA